MTTLLFVGDENCRSTADACFDSVKLDTTGAAMRMQARTGNLDD
jgi:hypothetical protein